MSIVAVSLVFIIAAVAVYIAGAVWLSKYAFRISKGLGVAVLLFPPITFYFAIFKLEESGKELPTAMCMFGIVTAVAVGIAFSHPLGLFVSGDTDTLKRLYSDSQEETAVASIEDIMRTTSSPSSAESVVAAADAAEAEPQEASADEGSDDADAEQPSEEQAAAEQGSAGEE